MTNVVRVVDFAKLSVAQVEVKLNALGDGLSQLLKPGRNKGVRGQKLEEALGIPPGSSLTDMVDGELKTFTKGETISVTMLGHCLPEIIPKPVDFRKSKVYEKIKQLIVVGFDLDGTARWETINETNSPKIYQEIAEDYNYIAKEINKAYLAEVLLHTISGPNKLLQIRTKASAKPDGTYTPLYYKDVYLKNKSMAFFLMSRFGHEVLEW